MALLRVQWVVLGSRCGGAALHQLLVLAGDEASDPQQAGPHAILVAVLTVRGRVLLPRHGPLVALLGLEEVDHALQDLCLSHLWILHVLMRMMMRRKMWRTSVTRATLS